MFDAEVYHKFPGTVRLFLPDRNEVSIGYRLFVFDIFLKLPGTEGVSQVARASYFSVKEGCHANNGRLFERAG